MVERWSNLGGVCLNVGCIPSKALLHAAKVIEEAESMSEHGIAFGAPALDLEKLREWQGSIVKKLTGGLRLLSKQRKVDVVQGTGRFVSPNVLEVMSNSGSERIHFDQCIIAVGSEAIRLPGMPGRSADHGLDGRVDVTGVLRRPAGHRRRHHRTGDGLCLRRARQRVSVVELTPQLIPGCDPDLVRPWSAASAVATSRFCSERRSPRSKRCRKDCVSLSRARRPRRPLCLSVCWWPSAACLTARRLPRTSRASRCRTAALFRSTNRCGPTCPTSSRLAMSRPCRCWRTRQCTKPRLRRKWRRASPEPSTCALYLLLLTRIPRLPGSVLRRPRRRQEHSLQEGGLSLGGERAVPLHRPR